MAGYPVSNAFWSASEAWAAAKRAQGRVGQRFGASFRRKEERWTGSAARYMRGSKRGLPSQLIRVDPALGRIVLDMMGAAAPALQAAMDTHLGALAFSAWRAWPVDSGLSKSLVSLEYDVLPGGDQFEGVIRSRAPYTVFIKGGPHRVLIARPGLVAAQRIADESLRALAQGA